MSDEKRPQVGIGVIVVNDGKVLLGKRTGRHGKGNWSPTGGHLEYGESFEECAEREVKEESNIKIKDIKFVGITNDFFEDTKKHYVTIFMESKYAGGKLKREPQEFQELGWFDWNNLPEPLFLPLQNLLKTGFKPGERK